MRATVLCLLLATSAAALCQPAFADDANNLSDDDSSKYYDLRDAERTRENNDPWEGFNRPVFDFNLFVDRNIEKPFISAYDVIPAQARHSFGNFLSNLGEPLNFIHGVLQLDPNAAFTSFWRFILNTTFGLGGLRDFAREEAGLHHFDENMGKTLGTWGAPTGPYVVLPILGPSSVRDTTGKVVDWFADPVGWQENTWQSIGQAVADGIDARDSEAGIIEHLYYQSLDPYVATRSAYQQHELFKANKE